MSEIDQEIDTLLDSEEETAPAKRGRPKKDALQPESTVRRVKVIFHNTNEDSGPIFAQVNGLAIQIKREEEVEIREEHLTLLDQCIYTRYEGKRKTGQVDENGDAILEDVWRHVKRFPYTRL